MNGPMTEVPVSARRWLAAAAAGLLFAGLAGVRPAPTAAFARRRPRPSPVPDRILVRVAGRVTSVALDDYVLGAVAVRGDAARRIRRRSSPGSTTSRRSSRARTPCRRWAAIAPRASTSATRRTASSTNRRGIRPRASRPRRARRSRARSGRVLDVRRPRRRGALPCRLRRIDGRRRRRLGRPAGALSARDRRRPAARNASAVAGLGDRRAAARWRSTPIREPTSAARWRDRGAVARRSGRAAGLGVRGERSYTVRGDVLRAVLNQTLGDRGHPEHPVHPHADRQPLHVRRHRLRPWRRPLPARRGRARAAGRHGRGDPQHLLPGGCTALTGARSEVRGSRSGGSTGSKPEPRSPDLGTLEPAS